MNCENKHLTQISSMDCGKKDELFDQNPFLGYGPFCPINVGCFILCKDCDNNCYFKNNRMQERKHVNKTWLQFVPEQTNPKPELHNTTLKADQYSNTTTISHKTITSATTSKSIIPKASTNYTDPGSGIQTNSSTCKLPSVPKSKSEPKSPAWSK